ncbi:adhesion G-protein coupled receptor G2-like [Mya arenaria]|uniref:adhesion G-protein coupled receptor G2-like n=1 Tax=Mya arenaria TaxID=6604 RepID=UPI0022DEF897|nr:adhesion G-protein coupled receptor G2-like [Mya arenaria]XP_052781798.1 adhesion G-protein coupled receptor G2-like [Mya arenaria]
MSEPVTPDISEQTTEPVTSDNSQQSTEPVAADSSQQTTEQITPDSSQQTTEPTSPGSSQQTTEVPVQESIITTVPITDKKEPSQTDELPPSNVHDDASKALPDSSNQTIVYIPPDINVEPAVIEKLTLGTLEMFLPNLQKAKSSLNEVLHNQEVLIETIQQENAKFTESAAMQELRDTMLQAKSYHSKLVNLKREMNGLMDKSVKLKRRAVKLQQQKQKEDMSRVMQRERELEREQLLQAKVAKPTQTSPQGQGQGHTQQDTPPQGHT